MVDRKRPGKGYRHLLTREDIYTFIALLPDWAELSRGLNAIVLAPGEYDRDEYLFGYHVPGVVHICAWERGLWTEITAGGYDEDRDLYERLGVECERTEDGVLCKWTEPQARAHQLLCTLLHELGHHHDRMTSRSQRSASRGEPYAEAYARRYGAQIWKSYLEAFNLF